MRISDWSSDVCSSDLIGSTRRLPQDFAAQGIIGLLVNVAAGGQVAPISLALIIAICGEVDRQVGCKGCVQVQAAGNGVMASVTAQIGRASCRERVCQYG